MGVAKRDLAKDRAYRYIKRRIVEGAISEGEFFTEGEIARDLGISRTPVREALLRLEADNLVRLLPKKGAFVPPVSDRQAREIMEARAVVEVFAARKAVMLGETLADVLDTYLAQQRDLMDEGDPSRFIACDREFHEAIVDASNNTIITELYSSLRDHQLRMGMAAILNSPQRYEQVLAEHKSIAEAVRTADAETLVAAIETHLETTLAALLGDRDPAISAPKPEGPRSEGR